MLYLCVCECILISLVAFFHSLVSCSCSLWCHLGIAPLQENQRMQTKLDALTREAFDLQETINWKDKKIGVGGPTWMLWQQMRR